MTNIIFAFNWQSLGPWEVLGWSAVFSIVGIILAIGAFKMLDLLTPGNLQKEIFENKNVAAAIFAGAFVIGICIVVAAAVGG